MLTPILRRVGDAAVDAYVASFVARSAGVQDLGLGGSRSRLLVTDDRAFDALAAALPDLQGGTITVAAASRCI
jgi:hypothetical protein